MLVANQQVMSTESQQHFQAVLAGVVRRLGEMGFIFQACALTAPPTAQTSMSGATGSG